jgi:hypothetical protein
VDEQTKAFLDGFNEVVPLEWLRYFDEKELEVSGLHSLYRQDLCVFVHARYPCVRLSLSALLAADWLVYSLPSLPAGVICRSPRNGVADWMLHMSSSCDVEL